MLERLGPKGLQGEEFVTCKIQSPKRENKDEIIDLLFYVAYIGDVTIGDNNSGEAFDLICVTKEKLLSDLSIVNRHFKQTETEIVKNTYTSISGDYADDANGETAITADRRYYTLSKLILKIRDVWLNDVKISRIIGKPIIDDDTSESD